MNWLIESLNQIAPRWWAYIFSAAWQSSLVALALLGLVALLRRRSSPLRYGLLVVALLKFAVPPMMSLPVGVINKISPELPIILTSPAPMPANLSPVPGEPERVMDNQASAMSFGADTTKPVVGRQLQWQAWLMLGYGLGSALFLIRIVGQFFRLSQLVRMAAELRDGPIFKLYLQIARQLGLRRIPRLLILNEAISPIAFGMTRPVVMLSRSMIERLDAAELHTILGHELAHHRRWDPCCNWFQLMLTVLWWFNPVFWILSRSLCRVREDCCDDLLLVKQITDNEAYCHTIIHAGREISSAIATGTTLGFAERLHPLHRRLRRIMDVRIGRAPKLSLAGMGLVLVLAGILLPGVDGETTNSSKSVPVAAGNKMNGTLKDEQQDTTRTMRLDANAGTQTGARSANDETLNIIMNKYQERVKKVQSITMDCDLVYFINKGAFSSKRTSSKSIPQKIFSENSPVQDTVAKSSFTLTIQNGAYKVSGFEFLITPNGIRGDSPQEGVFRDGRYMSFYSERGRGETDTLNQLTRLEDLIGLYSFIEFPAFVNKDTLAILRTELNSDHEKMIIVGNTDYNNPKVIGASRREIAFNASRDYLPEQIASKYPDGKPYFDIKIKYINVDKYGYLPDKITISRYSDEGYVNRTCVTVVRSRKFDYITDKSYFDIKYPVGTRIYDHVSDVTSIYGKNMIGMDSQQKK